MNAHISASDDEKLGHNGKEEQAKVEDQEAVLLGEEDGHVDEAEQAQRIQMATGNRVQKARCRGPEGMDLG